MEIALPADPKDRAEADLEGLPPPPAPTLTAVEAQRVTAVLQAMVKKLTLLGTLTSTPMASSSSSSSSSRSPSFHYDELSRFVREEVGRQLEEHQRLEARHAELSAEWDRLIRREEQRAAEEASSYSSSNDDDASGSSSDAAAAARRQELEALKAELQATGQVLTQNAQYVCRQLKENPRVSGFALKVERERQGVVRLLEAAVEELQARAGGFGETLCSKVAAEAFAQEHLSRVLEEERHASEAVLKIENELRTGEGQHKGRVRELQEAIAHLRTQLDTVQYKSEVETKYARREGNARAGAVRRVLVQEERDLGRKLARLRAQAEMEAAAHADLVAFLRGKHEETAAQVATWRAKSTKDLGELDGALLRLTEERAAALEELAVLRERRREEAVQEAAEKEAERLRQTEERKAELAARARRRAKTKVETAIATYALARRAKKEQEQAAAAGAKGKGKGKGKGKKGAAEGGRDKGKGKEKDAGGKAAAAAPAGKKAGAAKK